MGALQTVAFCGFLVSFDTPVTHWPADTCICKFNSSMLSNQTNSL